MEGVKFLEWVEIPGGKAQGDNYVWEGVAYVLFQTPIGAVACGFKVIQSVSSGDRFIGDGSWRLEADGVDSYKQWIMIDSNIAKERLKDYIVRNVLKIKQQKTQMSGSVKNTNTAQTNANNSYQQQKAQVEQSLSQGDDDDVPF